MYIQRTNVRSSDLTSCVWQKKADELLGATFAISMEKVNALIKPVQLDEQQLKDVDVAIELQLREEDGESELETILEYSDKIATYMRKLEYRMKLCSQQTGTKSASQNVNI